MIKKRNKHILAGEMMMAKPVTINFLELEILGKNSSLNLKYSKQK